MKTRRVRSPLIAFGLVGAIVLTSVATILQHQLQRTIRTSTTELVPAAFAPQPPRGSLRAIDLGYLHVSLPVEFDGAPHNVDGSLWMQIRGVDVDGQVTFVPPSFTSAENSPETRSLLTGFNALSSRAMPSMFELERAALRTLPYNLWDIPSLGFKESKTRFALLMTKQRVALPTTTAIRIHETPDFGAIILNEPDQVFLKVFDFRRGVGQGIMISAPPDLSEQVINAVLLTYRLTTDQISKPELAEHLRAAGITILDSTQRD